MKNKLILFLLLSIILPMCFAYWLNPGYNQQNMEVAVPLCFLVAFVFNFSKLTTIQVCFATVLGMMIAKIIKIIIDIYYDPTAHNLLPFELIIYGLIFSFVVLIGVGLSKLIIVIKSTIKNFNKHKEQA